MKRFLSVAVLLVVAFILHPQSINAANIPIYIDGVVITTDVEPEIKNNRTMVPLRVISENLRAKVDWTGSEISIAKNNRQIILRLNSDNVIMDGISTPLDAKPYLKNNRTMVPLRFVAEAFGSEVNYHDNNVTIHSEPLVIDGVAVKSMHITYQMTDGEMKPNFEGNAFISTLHDLFNVNKGDKVEAPLHYSWMYTIDIFGSYVKLGQYDFLDSQGNPLNQYETYKLVRGIPGETYEGYAEMLLYDKTEDQWHLFSRDANESILVHIETAKNKR